MKLIKLIKWFLTKCGAMVKPKKKESEKNFQKEVSKNKSNNPDDIYPMVKFFIEKLKNSKSGL